MIIMHGIIITDLAVIGAQVEVAAFGYVGRHLYKAPEFPDGEAAPFLCLKMHYIALYRIAFYGDIPDIGSDAGNIQVPLVEKIFRGLMLRVFQEEPAAADIDLTDIECPSRGIEGCAFRKVVGLRTAWAWRSSAGVFEDAQEHLLSFYGRQPYFFLLIIYVVAADTEILGLKIIIGPYPLVFIGKSDVFQADILYLPFREYRVGRVRSTSCGKVVCDILVIPGLAVLGPLQQHPDVLQFQPVQGGIVLQEKEIIKPDIDIACIEQGVLLLVEHQDVLQMGPVEKIDADVTDADMGAEPFADVSGELLGNIGLYRA